MQCAWQIEERIGSAKSTLEMSVLRSKTVANARREVASILLGHNLVWMLIHEAAETHDVAPEDISFAHAVKAIVAYSATLPLVAPCHRPALRAKMLQMIARQRNHHPYGRVEPRQVKRDRRRYPQLKQPRPLARAQGLT